MFEWCISIYNPWVIALSALLLISALLNVSVFRKLAQSYVMRWHWVWSVEERLDEEVVEEENASKSSGGFYPFIAVVLGVAVIALIIFNLVD